MAKTISVSADDVTYYTLPGSSGDYNLEGSGVEDTVFGQSFGSSQPSIIGWTVSANSYYKGYAGYVATFKKSGTSTLMTAEAMSLVSGKTYKVTDTAKNVFDRANTITFYDTAVAIAEANILSVDHLFGRVTFVPAYTPTGAVTVTANYLPLASVGTARDFTLTMSAESVDTTDFATAQANGGFSTATPGLKTAGIEASGFYSSTNAFKTAVTNRSELIVEINPDGSSLSIARGYFKAISTGQSGDVGGNEDESISFELSVPQSSSTTTANVVTPFKWLHDATTTLHASVQTVLTAWADGTTIYVKYLSDGTNGYKGTAVVTDTSLATAVDGINEFSISFVGSGAPTAVP